MAKTPVYVLRIEADRDWIALNAYRMALELIVEEEPFSAAAVIARHVLEEFPGSFNEAPSR